MTENAAPNVGLAPGSSTPGRWQVAAGADLYLDVDISTGVIAARQHGGALLGLLARVTPGNAKAGGPDLMAALVPAALLTARATWPHLVPADEAP